MTFIVQMVQHIQLTPYTAMMMMNMAVVIMPMTATTMVTVSETMTMIWIMVTMLISVTVTFMMASPMVMMLNKEEPQSSPSLHSLVRRLVLFEVCESSLVVIVHCDVN